MLTKGDEIVGQPWILSGGVTNGDEGMINKIFFLLVDQGNYYMSSFCDF